MKAKAYDGLYYSFLTHRIFEAVRVGDDFHIQYTDGEFPHSKEIPFGSFSLQAELGFYDCLIDYFQEDL